MKFPQAKISLLPKGGLFVILFNMVISSIDLKNGQVVQLKNGKDAVLERNDWQAIIEDFAFYGETAVIDLDAALGNLITEGSEKGNTVNTEIVHKLLRRGNIRVGGGVRSVKKAKELISLGAEKVIIGSSAWKDGALDEVFLTELTKAIGKQRIIISIDAIDGIIAVKGWKETAGIPLLEAAVQAEKWASELLFTCVEREGCMTGFDLALAKKLRKLVSCRLVVAGGVSSLEEIIALEKMQIDVQLGMALYTNVVSLRDAFVECLNWESAEKNTEGLISVIAQSPSGEVLMNGFANKEAFYKSIDEKKLTFWSRSRNTLWTKGESSGNILKVLQLRADCDRDAVLATVEPQGPTCHTGSWSCFGGEAIASSSFQRLSNIIAERFSNPKPGSYTATLTDTVVREKIEEEAEELIEAEGKDEVVWEAADLLYFISVLLHRENLSWDDVLNELDRRHKK